MPDIEEFLSRLERSRLLTAGALAASIRDWRRHKPANCPDEAADCARFLVQTNVLTQWQADKLLEGRYRGFSLGQYKLLDRVGSGGMSTVYLAEHVLMQRRVAIKVLSHDRIGAPEYLARFQVEARAAAALDHRNIVRAFDVGVDGKIHFLVMEYVAGRDLQAIVAQEGPLEVHRAAHYIAQAAGGLEHAHRRGWVHRDIKPANLLVDGHGTVKILDMGLAQFAVGAAGRLPAEEHVVGTADFLAPEQAACHPVDARADIYSLGCTLYFLLTAHPPFPQGTVSARMAAHQTQMPPSILFERRDASRSLVSICRRMMEKRPDDRFPSAAAVQQTLVDWLVQETAAGRTNIAAVRSISSSTLGFEAPGADALDDRPGDDAALSETQANRIRATLKQPDKHSGERKSPPRRAHALPDSADARVVEEHARDPRSLTPRDRSAADGPLVGARDHRARMRAFVSALLVALVTALVTLAGFWLTLSK